MIETHVKTATSTATSPRRPQFINSLLSASAIAWTACLISWREADLNEAARAADATREANGAVYGERLK
jgi:hypothetical protein